MKVIILVSFLMLSACCSGRNEKEFQVIKTGVPRVDLVDMSPYELMNNESLVGRAVKLKGMLTIDDGTVVIDQKGGKIGLLTFDASMLDIDQLFAFYDAQPGGIVSVVGVFDRERYVDGPHYPNGYLMSVSYIEYPAE